MSSSAEAWLAAWHAQGAGTIREAQVAEPSWSAWNTPTLAAWQEPRSSHDRITMRSSARWPSRSARDNSVDTLATLSAGSGAGSPQPDVRTLGLAGGGGEGWS